MQKGGDDFFEFLNDFDDYNKKILLEEIEEMGNRQQHEPTGRKGKKADAKDRLISNLKDTYHEGGGNKLLEENLQDLDFTDELDEPGKRFRQYEIYQPPKYKILGYNHEGKPIFKVSDVFLTDDMKVRDIIDKEFNDIIHPKKPFQPQTGELSTADKMTDFEKIIEQWEKKEYEDFTANNKNKLNEKELEEIVVNRGDQKKNYFIYKFGEKNNFTIDDVAKKSKINGQLLNPKFPQNLFRFVERKKMQYAQIEEFESESEEDKDQSMEDPEDIKYWGQIKGYNPDKKRKKKKGKYILQEKMSEEKANEERALVEQILKQHRYYNSEIVNEEYWKPRSEFDRIEYHLEDPNFFHTKIHTTLQKKSELLHSVEKGKDSKSAINKNIKNSTLIGFGDRSRISGSLITGNKQLSARPSNFDGGYEEGNEDHETIEQKIQRQMNHYSRKPISHSDVATKLYYLKFSTKVEDFASFHRYEFKFDKYLVKKVKVELLRHTKPIKNKGTDFNINIEKTDSYKKFSKPESLSLASEEQKEFILIEYIEETPLLMSDVGMCERMVLQVNHPQVIEKISRDIMMNKDFQEFQDQRDNAQSNFKNVSTEEKMEHWRKNIKEIFGENGKVYLWQPKKQGKLIGNPDGFGVSLMESNLGCVPIVKKQPNKRDFVLVRDGNKWVLRKIDSIYVSGQVQPKRIVYTPDNRSYNTFLEKYQMDFIKKWILESPQGRLHIESVKGSFPCNQLTAPENRLRKILKKMKATTKDNKNYTITFDDAPFTYLLQPEEACLYWRMQKSLADLHEVGIRGMKSMEKMKSILRKYFKSDKDNLDNFAIARMIKGQLQLTSWYLTESFNKFLEKKARIEMRGHADPTKGNGGYSFIKKPQKERTDKEEVQEKQEKIKLSGTEYDLRKLKAEDSQNILRAKGYSEEDLVGKHRWDLVEMVKKQKNTEFSRKQRETREEKEENEKKERSKLFNELLKLLSGETIPNGYEYSYNRYIYLEDYRQNERQNWENCKEIYERRIRENENENQDDFDDEDS